MKLQYLKVLFRHSNRHIDKWDRIESSRMDQNISKNLVYNKVIISYRLEYSTNGIN